MFGAVTYSLTNAVILQILEIILFALAIALLVELIIFFHNKNQHPQ